MLFQETTEGTLIEMLGPGSLLLGEGSKRPSFGSLLGTRDIRVC